MGAELGCMDGGRHRWMAAEDVWMAAGRWLGHVEGSQDASHVSQPVDDRWKASAHEGWSGCMGHIHAPIIHTSVTHALWVEWRLTA